MSDRREFRLRMQIRWTDIDRLGHVNQSVYHELLEEARAGFLLGLLQSAIASGANTTGAGAWVVVRVELDYRHEVRKDHGEVEIIVRPAHVGSSSVRLEHDICLPDGTVAASGATTLVAWDPVARGKRPIAPAEREALGVTD